MPYPGAATWDAQPDAASGEAAANAAMAEARRTSVSGPTRFHMRVKDHIPPILYRQYETCLLKNTILGRCGRCATERIGYGPPAEQGGERKPLTNEGGIRLQQMQESQTARATLNRWQPPTRRSLLA